MFVKNRLPVTADWWQQIRKNEYGLSLFCMVIAIIVLGLLDAGFTMYSIQSEYCEEVNPFMKFLLQAGESIFIFGKIILTGICLAILCFYAHVSLARRIIIYVLVVYSFLFAIHLFLYFMR